MNRRYRRMTSMDRCQIDALLSAGLNKSEIAVKLNFHKSSISREISRNLDHKGYDSLNAHNLAIDRLKRCRKAPKITPAISEVILRSLSAGWSPEQISGRLFLEKKFKIHLMTIYRFTKKHDVLRGYLRRNKKRGAGRKIQLKSAEKKLSIEKRPKPANDRKRIGDWERDLFFCANKSGILILTDRKSRLSGLTRIKTLRAPVMVTKTKQIWKRLNTKGRSDTNDRGTEFAIPTVGNVKVYYCGARRPDQRGTVVNTIGLLRQYLPRKMDISGLSTQALKKIENLINLRPRKCLGFQTPYEVFYKRKVALAM